MTRLLALFAVASLGACSTVDKPATADGTEPGDPGLAVGDTAPDATLLTGDGGEVSLASYYDSPTVVIFYRGGWCPYCTGSLTEWQGHLADFEAAGANIVAITPEKPEHNVKTADKHEYGFTILSDARNEAAEGYRVNFALDADTVTKYRSFNVNLDKRNASGTWSLPAPGTFVVDRNGEVAWAFADWDYTKRADPEEVLAAVRGLE